MITQSKSLGLTEFWFWPKSAREGETQKSTHMNGKLKGLTIYAKTEERKFQPDRLIYTSYILLTPPSFQNRAKVCIPSIRKGKAKVKPTGGPGFPLTPGGPGKPVVPWKERTVGGREKLLYPKGRCVFPVMCRKMMLQSTTDNIYLQWSHPI